MQVHGPSSILHDGGRIYAEPNSTFVSMHIGDVRLYIDTTEECDWIIRAAVAAKDMLLRKQAGAPPAAVIIDSDRTCDQANPDTGAWCHRDHGVHRDTDGEEWRTDTAYTGHLRTPAIPAGPDDPHRVAIESGSPYACCEHCIPGCSASCDAGHKIPCTTPGCPSAQPVAVAS